jgi:hypothetical protein
MNITNTGIVLFALVLSGCASGPQGFWQDAERHGRAHFAYNPCANGTESVEKSYESTATISNETSYGYRTSRGREVHDEATTFKNGKCK